LEKQRSELSTLSAKACGPSFLLLHFLWTTKKMKKDRSCTGARSDFSAPFGHTGIIPVEMTTGVILNPESSSGQALQSGVEGSVLQQLRFSWNNIS
jgi:hypothetical protein